MSLPSDQWGVGALGFVLSEQQDVEPIVHLLDKWVGCQNNDNKDKGDNANGNKSEIHWCAPLIYFDKHQIYCFKF